MRPARSLCWEDGRGWYLRTEKHVTICFLLIDWGIVSRGWFLREHVRQIVWTALTLSTENVVLCCWGGLCYARKDIPTKRGATRRVSRTIYFSGIRRCTTISNCKNIYLWLLPVDWVFIFWEKVLRLIAVTLVSCKEVCRWLNFIARLLRDHSVVCHLWLLE